MSELGNLAETAQQVSDAIAEVLGLEVEIVDSGLLRVAGTGKYRGRVGLSLANEGAAYTQVMKTGRGMLVTEPGRELVCRDCPKHAGCEETAELSAPIIVNGEVVGVIGLLCFDQEQRLRLMSRLQSHQDFIERMAALLAGKVHESRLFEKERLAAQEVAMLLDRIADPVIAVDQEGRLIHCNLPAGQLLGVSGGTNGNGGPSADNRHCLAGLGFVSQALRDGKGFEDKELFLDFGTGEKPYLVSARLLTSGGKTLGVMAVLRPSAELQRWAYNLTHAEGGFALDGIIGRSEAIRSVKEKALRVADSASTVLILGESGTGKELLARGIHHAGKRAEKPFVAVNCAAIPDELLESELFGYEEGAFTGARKRGKPGKFELADGGTLYLGEVGDTPLHLQAKLLRVLQEKEVERLGGT
ncbi:MAG: sigma 54-interacting transcriptional regulator, partial [Firmicutes bacterium]|nr:sigma 54-interacting transcriptional regulator [Bacillota bacterium]